MDINLRICFFISQINKGGAERAMVALSDYMSRNNEVYIILLDGSQSEYKFNERIRSIVIGDGITESRSYSAIFKRITKLRSVLKRKRFDCIYCFAPLYAIYAILARVGLPKSNYSKIICAVHYNPFFRKQKDGKIQYYLERLLLPMADGFVFLTEKMKEYYSYSKRIMRRSAIIPNALFTKGLDQYDIQFENRDPNKIVAVGRLDDVKDYPAMIRIFKSFVQAHNGCYLEIYGDGSQKENLQCLIDENLLSKSIVLKGNVDNIYESIHDARLFIMTSKSEAWGLALMEAMACGIPSIAFDCDFGPREMIRNNVNGIIVSDRDEKKFVAAMEQLITDNELAEKISREAVKIREEYSPDAILKKIMMFIRNVVYGEE